MSLKDEELAAELTKWFQKYENYPDIWNRTATGELIKQTLIRKGNWKNKKRGNPSKGGRERNKTKQ